MSAQFELSSNWEFKICEEKHPDFKMDNWLQASVPGTIHTDLLFHKLIDEPFYDDNELKLDWISETGWNYKTTFNKPESFNNDDPVYLIFDGIDTAAEVILNGKKIDSVNNMFLKHEFNITSFLKDNNNLLEVKFQSAVKYARALETEHGKLPVALRSERVFIRKAQYSFSWDWGPSFPTMGIWRPVYLLQKEKNFIEDFSFITNEISAKTASVALKIKLNKNLSSSSIKITLSIDGFKIEKIFKIIGKKFNEFKFEIENPKLWWPGGEGEQNLYDLQLELLKDERVINKINKNVGIRTIRLELLESDNPTFKLIINNKPIYAKGVNWIPADSFLPRVKEEKYRKLLQYAKDANMNIVRVWGGGIYENDIFYELCDEMGLLVWQDFMFACAAYPEYEEFVSSVEKEIKQNVQRLRHHPSIAVWCGNNENEWIWHQEQKSSYKKMPGYKIYHNIIPKLLEENDPTRPYWPSSPFGFDADPNSYKSGNRHEWGIWSKWIDYSEVKNDNSLFVTEFGFQGPANKKTFEKYLSKENRKINSPVFEFHNKQIEGPERILKFLAGNLPIRTKWEDFIYLAQLNQALALKTCLEHWRFNCPVTNGSIIWQINDCWPVTSWAVIDFELRPKMSYYFVKNIFKPSLIRFSRDQQSLKIVGLNQLSKEKLFNINLKIYDDRTGEALYNKDAIVNIKSWTKQNIFSIPQKNIPANNCWTSIASLYDKKNELLFRNFYSPTKWKYKILPKAKIDITLMEDQIKLVSDVPAYFVDLFHPDAEFDDRGFMLLPGEKIFINIKTKLIDTKKIKIFSLNNYLAN